MNQEHREHRIKGKKVELILEQLNSLPTLPSVASRLLQITAQTDTQAKEVVELIEDIALLDAIFVKPFSMEDLMSQIRTSLAECKVATDSPS